MGVQQIANDGQAHTRAAMIATGREEGRKDVAGIPGCDAMTIIRDGEYGSIGKGGHCNRDAPGPAFTGIAQQLRQHNRHAMRCDGQSYGFAPRLQIQPGPI